MRSQVISASSTSSMVLIVVTIITLTLSDTFASQIKAERSHPHLRSQPSLGSNVLVNEVEPLGTEQSQLSGHGAHLDATETQTTGRQSIMACGGGDGGGGHRFSEFDSQFILHDYRTCDEASRRRRSTEKRPTKSDRESQIQTIYFGGFFPWLAEEQAPGQSLSDGDSSSGDIRPNWIRKERRRDKKNQHLIHMTDDALKAARNHSTINYNQERQTSLQMPAQSSSMHYPNSETRHQLGKFILPAVRLALDHINTNRSILSAYKLEVIARDTQCNATISLKQFFDMVYEEPKKMLLYGDACRVSTDPIAKASYFFDLIQISYADTDPIYTIENYPNFFRVVPSENALSLARIPFIRHFNWTRVGTIYQNLPRYSLPHSKLLTDLERFRIVIKQSVSLPGSVDGLQDRDLGDELRKLKEKDVRIILGNFDEEWALLLFCEAYREKMIGRKYQWLLTGFSEAKLWHYYESKGSSCSKQELVIAMDGYIITDITPVTRSQRRTISGLMAHEYLSEYQRRAREMSISIEENKFYGYVYDGIWAIALALNRVDTLLRYYSQLASKGLVKLKPEFDEISSLIDFKYHKPIWVRLIRDALNATRFEGVTGTVSFQKNERPGLITFSQFQAFRDMTEVIIGSYDALKDQLDLNVGFPIIWRGSSPPIDYTIQRVMPFRINRTLFVIISILALLGIVLACVFLFVNIKFRNQRYIKMSSPYLNNLIIIGCILTFTSVIILGLDSGLTSEYNFPYICNARAWVLMAGFTLAFGSMFSKTFRVHSIFTNIKLHKKVIKDYKLFMVVFILLTFDVCILIVWQYFDPFYRETNNGTSLQDPDNEDVIIVPEMEHCQSKRMTIFLGVIYVYKGLLMAFGCFLAWETRHVSIPALNDSKYIGLSVYNVVIMCVIGASLSFILRDQQDASFVIISIFIIFCSTTTLCLVFVPKLIELKQNPRASDHRVRATLKTFKKNYHGEALAHGCRDIHGNIIGRGYGMNLNDRIKLLVDENGKQRSVLKEKTYELEALTSKYRRIQSMLQSGQFLQAVNTSSSAATGAATPASTTGAHHHHQLTPRQGPAASGMVQSSSCAHFPASSTALGAGVAACLDQPAVGGVGGAGGLLTGRSPIRDRVSFSAAIGGTTLEQFSACMPPAGNSNAKQLNDTTSLRRSSPMMSSIAQITNTTTTSSTTNNVTETTGDFSSSRLAATTSSIGTTSNSGILQQHQQQHHYHHHQSGESRPQFSESNLEDELDLGERVQAISRELAASRRNQRNEHREQQAAGSGSILPEASKQRLFRSQDDLSMFTVLSHPRGGSHLQRSRGAVDENGDQCEDKLGQWLAGPFCTVLLRQTSWDMKQRLSSNQRGATCGANQHASRLRQQPRHRASLHSTRTRFRQQSGHHAGNLMLASAAATGANGGACERRMPRTLSMIEYLGLNDFDMIARRHEKILRYRRRMMMSCCASSSCCLSLSNNRHHTARNNISSHQPMIMSDGNLTNTANPNSSSCDELPLNYSDGLMQTTSLISCSTCCSLASQIYASNSELDYSHYNTSENQHLKHSHRTSCRNNTNFGHSSISGSSTSSSSMSTTNGLDLARSLSSASSSSTSRSSSIVAGGAAGQLRRRERANRCGGNHLDQTNSSSQSSSLADISKTRRTVNCPIHQQSHGETQQKPEDVQLGPSRNFAAGQDASTSSGRHEQMQQNMSRKSSGNGAQLGIAQGSFASPEQKSLCTSGLLYGPPAAREDANQASASIAPKPDERPHSAIDQLGSGGPVDGNLCDHLMTGQPDISIKCDILEDL